MKKTKKIGGVLKTYKYQFIFLNTRKYGGVSKNTMPTLMGVPFLKHPPNIGEKNMMGKMPST
jgi:hypothetical protein